MAKKKVAKKKRVPKAVRELRERLQGPELSDHTGKVARALTNKLHVETGDEFVTNLGRARGLILGIPVPSLAFEYCIRMNILPLGRMMILVGIEKVGKSGLLFDIIRWFRKQHGFGVLLEHESKFSPEWASSIIGWDDPDAMIHVPCDSIEGWQRHFTKSVAWVKKEMIGDKKHVRPGKTWPFVLGVDSLMGKSTDSVQKSIDETGASSKHWADEARSITDYMRYIPQKITRWPFLMIGVNHLKPTKDPKTGARIRQTAGGRGVDFQESIELELNWGSGGRSKSAIRLVDCEGMRLKLSCENNSFARAGNRIDVVVWSWQEEYENDDGEEDWRPVVVWDWHGATVNLLLREYAYGSATDAKKIKEVVNIQKVSNQSLYYARSLGVSKSDPQPADVIGKMIYDDPEMMKALRKIFKIRTYPTFQPGMDFDEVLREQKERLAKQPVRVKKRPAKKAPKKVAKEKTKAPRKKTSKSTKLVPPPASAKKRKPRGR